MATMHTARVKYKLGDPKPSKYEGKPDCANIVVEINGNQERIYVDYGTSDWNIASAFKAGDQVQVLEDKGKYKLIGTGGQMAEAVQMTTPPKAQEPHEPRKLDADQAKNYALTYAAVFNLLSEKMPVATPAEVVGTAASTVFIALTRN